MKGFQLLHCCYVILFLGIAVPSAVAQDIRDNVEAIECATIRYHLTVIEGSLDRLCDTDDEIVADLENETEPCCSAVWESIPFTLIGNIDMGITSDQSFIIPYSVPHDATEVLVYIMMKAGFTAGGFTHTKIYTKDTSGHHYNKYMTTHGYPQDAHTYTTENMWFPLTTERRVHVVMDAVVTGNTDGRIHVIGYR